MKPSRGRNRRLHGISLLANAYVGHDLASAVVGVLHAVTLVSTKADDTATAEPSEDSDVMTHYNQVAGPWVAYSPAES
jgi:hypothetical protein